MKLLVCKRPPKARWWIVQETLKDGSTVCRSQHATWGKAMRAALTMSRAWWWGEMEFLIYGERSR